jgi:hypothetical protein
MERQQVEIKLNIDGVTNPLFALLNECQNVILFGFRVIDNIGTFPEQTAEEINTIPIQIGDRPKSLDDQKKRFRTWLLKKGFEDFAKGIKLAFIEAYCFGTIVKKRDEIKDLKRFLTEIEYLRKTAIEQSLPGLLTKVRPLLVKTLEYEEQISTINNARNCLIHANGLVTDRHANDRENNRLVIKGNRFLYYFEKNGERYPMKLGQPGPENAPLMMSAEKFELYFNIGQQIEINLKDFNDFINTCLYFALDLKESLVKN